ncbi:MAG: 50S ribosomal protein L28 [Anaerolineaceae bacterium]|nr:MAG: 50S ribosomal protein L28 [Anaerolineaceae bacterium]
MARCENCGKTTKFGQSRSFSMKATKRKFRPNLQKVKVMEGGRMVQKTLCAKCIKRLSMVKV